MSVLQAVLDLAPLREAPPLVKLSSVADINPRRFTIQPADDDFVSFIPMKAVEEETGRHSVGETKRWSEVKKGYTPFQEGDVIFAKITPCMENGKFAVAKGLHNRRAAGSTEFHVFRPHENLDTEYLLWFMFSHDVRENAKRNMRGAAGQLRVPTSFFEQLEIPLPSLEEQREIVEEIETQLSRLEAGVSALKRAQANLKRYRAAVLKAACEGRLVPAEAELARTEGRDYETGTQLLDRILVERRRIWTGRGRYTEPSAVEQEPYELPDGWTWLSLGHITWSVKDGPHYSPKYVPEGVPFISGGNVRPEGVDFDSAKQISRELHQELCARCRPELGDILYTKGGTTGIARVNTYEREFSVWVHVAVLKLMSGVDPWYVQHALNSPPCYRQAQGYTHGVGNQDLGLTRMVKIVLPLPPLAEQERIVAEVERRLSVVDGLEATITANLRRATRLRQAVLQSAFSPTKSREKE